MPGIDVDEGIPPLLLGRELTFLVFLSLATFLISLVSGTEVGISPSFVIHNVDILSSIDWQSIS